MDKHITFSNGVKAPLIGYGTFKIDNKTVENLTLTAFDVGYTYIDTATAYANELGIGYALDNMPIKREDLFLVTKIANDDQGYNETLKAVERSLASLNVDYLDLVLIHWPQPKSDETWLALEELYEQGKVRTIGVSNFHKQHLDKLLKTAKIKPMINQLEHHPYLTQKELAQTCQEQGILLQAWSPLAKGEVFQDELLKALADKYKVSVSQIVMRWQLQSGWSAVVKASSAERMRENLNVFDFEISDEDMKSIDCLNKDHRTGSNPDDFTF